MKEENIQHEITKLPDNELKKYDPSEIRGRVNCIVRAYGLNSRGHLARTLGVTTPTVSMWIKRGRISPELLLENLPFINPDFIETGTGEVRLK
jgi:hypothetical protein